MNSPSAPTLAKRLLVVEDDSLVRHALLRQLERAFRVDAANGPDAAVVAMREVPYDIVLTDYAMPERSGVAFARELRQSGFHGPIVLLTADPTAPELPEALHTGLIQAIVPKPWNYRELIRLLSARVA